MSTFRTLAELMLRLQETYEQVYYYKFVVHMEKENKKHDCELTEAIGVCFETITMCELLSVGAATLSAKNMLKDIVKHKKTIMELAGEDLLKECKSEITSTFNVVISIYDVSKGDRDAIMKTIGKLLEND